MSASEADAVQDAIAHYLRTGETDPMYPAWSDRDYLAMARRAHHDLRSALISEIERRTRELDLPAMPSLDVAAFTRKKLEPMVWGLFPTVERPVVLDLLAHSVVFVTRDNFAERVARAKEPAEDPAISAARSTSTRSLASSVKPRLREMAGRRPGRDAGRRDSDRDFVLVRSAPRPASAG